MHFWCAFFPLPPTQKIKRRTNATPTIKMQKRKHGLRGRKLWWANHISLNSWRNLEIFTAMLKSCGFIRSCVLKKNLGLCRMKVILPLHFFYHVVRPHLLVFFCETKKDIDTESWWQMKENPKIWNLKYHIKGSVQGKVVIVISRAPSSGQKQ